MQSWTLLLGLGGFFSGVLLYLFLLGVVLQRRTQSRLPLPLLSLLCSLLLWYAGNFLALLLRQMDFDRVSQIVGAVETTAFASLALLPALLFHSHQAYVHERFPLAPPQLRAGRLVLLFLYGPLLLGPMALSRLLPATVDDPLQRLGPFTLPFLFQLAVSYGATAWLCRRVTRSSAGRTEVAVFSRLRVVYLCIPVFNFIVFFGFWPQQGDGRGLLTTGILLSSLIPTAIVAYYIYRHGFLQIFVHRGIALVLAALLTLGLYVVGIRRLVLYLTDELSAPALLVEGIFVVAILILVSPVSGWLENHIHRRLGSTLEEYQRLARRLRRIDITLLDRQGLNRLIEGMLERELPAEAVHINATSTPSFEGEHLHPLQTADTTLGYLHLLAARTEDPQLAARALPMIASEVAFLLERWQLLELKLKMEKDLIQKSHLALLGTMAATVAHNVKNPLSSMKTLLQLWEEAPNLSSQQAKEARMMVKEIDRLSETVADLLRYSRAGQTGRIEISTIRVAQFLESVSSLFQGDLKARDLTLQTGCEPVNLTLRSNPDILGDVVKNLLSNAIDASTPGDRIRLRACSEGGRFRLTVRDQGSGVPEDQRETIFSPFFTTKARGTGLGLAAARKRIEQLGGDLRLDPVSDGPGAGFTVELPSDPSQAGAQRQCP